MSLLNAAVASVCPKRRKVAARNGTAIAVFYTHFRNVLGVPARACCEYLSYPERRSLGIIQIYFRICREIGNELFVVRKEFAAEFFEHIVHGVYRTRARINRIFTGEHDVIFA